MSESTERWRDVVGYEGYYEVSDLGRVRSLPRLAAGSSGSWRRLPGRILRPGINPRTGRRVVNLRGDGMKRTHTVYRLVLTAFVGPAPVGMEACHNDGDCVNDVLSNLRWDTSSGNSYDIVRHGRHNNTLKTHCPRSHLLNEPNLVASTLAAGRRDCLACHKARARMYKLAARGIEFDFLAAADAHYSNIMGQAAAA